MNKPLMKCGHQANSTDKDGKPACVICVGLDSGALKQVKSQPDLTGRVARCYCGDTQPSSKSLDGVLAFFEYRGPGSKVAAERCLHCSYNIVAHQPEEMAWLDRHRPVTRPTVVEDGRCPGFESHGPFEFDIFYCGCRGWD